MSDGLSDANRRPDYTRDPVFGACNACNQTHCRCASDRIDELEEDNRFLSDEAHKIAYELAVERARMIVLVKCALYGNRDEAIEELRRIEAVPCVSPSPPERQPR